MHTGTLPGLRSPLLDMVSETRLGKGTGPQQRGAAFAAKRMRVWLAKGTTMTTPTDGTPSYAPGWYPDVNAPGTERWYDGNGWTQQTRVAGGPVVAPGATPAAAASAATAKKPWFKRKGIIIPVGIVAGLIVISSIGSALGGGRSNTADPDDKDAPAAVAEQPDEQEPEEEPEPEPEPEMVAVPGDLVGMTAEEAAAALRNAGLEADYDGEDGWKVLEVDASAKELEAGSTVALILDEPPALTLAQENVIEEAQRYVDVMAFSRRGLFDQLTSEYGGGYEDKDAKFALDYLEDHKLVNWKNEAVEAAEQYLDAMSFSRSGLLQQLTSEYGSQFTKKQAEYALEQVGY